MNKEVEKGGHKGEGGGKTKRGEGEAGKEGRGRECEELEMERLAEVSKKR